MSWFKRKKKSEPERQRGFAPAVPAWMIRTQELIAKHSTSARTKGKYKGHSSTDSLAWVIELAGEIQLDIRRSATQDYDENMTLASRLGMVLVAWYVNTHRAKSYDTRRPVRHRQSADASVTTYRVDLTELMISDALMGTLFEDQPFQPPYGKLASGGDFV